MVNARFSEYTTSGAFTLTLTRNQVSSLAMLEGGAMYAIGKDMAALERKGLAVPVPHPSPDNLDRLEWRATHAGLLTAALTREAGLTNGATDPVAVELDGLRAELTRARQEAAEARLVARSALARKEELELDLHNEKALRLAQKPSIRILRRDPLPETSDAELAARAMEPA